jgi:hypothetical protein
MAYGEYFHISVMRSEWEKTFHSQLLENIKRYHSHTTANSLQLPMELFDPKIGRW